MRGHEAQIRPRRATTRLTKRREIEARRLDGPMAGCGLKLTSAQLTMLRTIKARMKRQKIYAHAQTATAIDVDAGAGPPSGWNLTLGARV